MSTSDALQLANELDPEGERTIGVITKVDIMDRGSNAKEMILGKIVPLKLGYVAVKNRGQQDINDKVKVEKALNQEKEYFLNHPVYRSLDPDYFSTTSLTNKLSKHMFSMIRNLLPTILKEINDNIRDANDKLKEFGEPMPNDDNKKLELLWQLVSNFLNSFKNSLTGKYDKNLSN